MTDAYHLFSGTLPIRFGPEVYSLIENDLKKMCYSKAESIFEQSFSIAMKLLKDSGRLNANLEEQLLYNEWECYAQHILIKKGEQKVFVDQRFLNKTTQVFWFI